jgi:hypothetical protein
MNVFDYLFIAGTIVASIILLYLLINTVFGHIRKEYHSNWNTLLDGFDFSPKEFYRLLKTELQSHGITKIKIKEIYINEGGVFSHSRIYLRVTWKSLQYDICAAKFGNGFFISWWMLYKNSFTKILVSKIPFFGLWIVNKLFPTTYYQVDTASMLMSYAQKSVLNVIEEITNNKGVRTLTEAERKPILNDIYKR